MAKSSQGILAVFTYLDEVCKAMETIKDDPSFRGHEVLSYTSYHELEHSAGYGFSAVRWFTGAGALTGAISGFSLALYTDYDWPIVVGGKTPGLFSFPPFFVFGFELMILFGALATIGGMFWMGRFPDPKAEIMDPRITDDKFVIFVPGVGPESDQGSKLTKLGAEEIKAYG